MTSLRRRHLITEILRASGAASQDDLICELAARGFRAAQATVSRDLRALGAVKTPAGYRLPGDVGTEGAATDRGDVLRGVVRRHVASVIPAASIVVVRTAPGHAGVVADALDHADVGARGTIAGDDTVFAAMDSEPAAAALAAGLAALLVAPGVRA